MTFERKALYSVLLPLLGTGATVSPKLLMAAWLPAFLLHLYQRAFQILPFSGHKGELPVGGFRSCDRQFIAGTVISAATDERSVG